VFFKKSRNPEAFPVPYFHQKSPLSIPVPRWKKQVEVDGKVIVIESGESLLIQAGTRVRYSNPFSEVAEYRAICNPAFRLETVRRENES